MSSANTHMEIRSLKGDLCKAVLDHDWDLNHKEVLKLSQELDLLILEVMREKLDSKKKTGV